MHIDSPKTVFLIDGSSLLYRAYYGLRPLHTSKGVPVQAVYSFCRMIKKMIDMFNPKAMVVVWDSKGKTTRHTMYEYYKATRQAPPSDLFEQKKHILEFSDLIELCHIAQPGVEADDIMYSLGQELVQAGDEVCLVTSDKDISQMLKPGISIYDPFKDKIFNADDFAAANGFPVEKLPFFYALLGDTSDNIPGVKGIGKKGALELVTQFASLEDLYANIPRVYKPKAQQILLEQKENAFLSEKLFLLQYHPTHLAREKMDFDKTKWAQALPLFQELEFTSLIKEISQEKPAPAKTVQTKIDGLSAYTFKTITTKAQLQELCAELKRHKLFAIDTETTGLNPFTADLVGVSICYQEGTAYYIPCGHKIENLVQKDMFGTEVALGTHQQQLSLQEVVAQLQPILQDAQYKKYLHHAKFDQLVLHHAGMKVNGIIFDTLIAARLVVQDWQKISLKYLSGHYLNEEMLSYDDVVKANKYKDFSYVPLDLATQYAAADAHQTWRLVPIFQIELRKQGMHELFEQVDLPLVQVLYRMEVAGIALDLTVLKNLEQQVNQELALVTEQIIGFVGDAYKNINLNSPKQVGELLFVHLQLPPQQKSGKGEQYSTNVEALEALATLHPVPNLILKYRELFKLKSTYVDALPAYVDSATGVIHTSFSQTAVATGRLASSDPNLQNIPTGPGLGSEIRAAFKPQAGHVFVSADYSQIELRVLGHLSHDTSLTNAFLQGHDIHAQTAAGLFDIPLAQVTGEQRQVGKRINFSILYGLTPFGLSKDLNISFKEAKNYIDKYFAQYPRVMQWMDNVVESTKEKGYVATLWGRRRYIPGIYENNKNLYEFAKRAAINTVAQGTAADIMRIGMINLDNAFKQEQLHAHIVLQIHDELLISAAQDQLQQVQELTKKVLQSVVDWQIPLEVTVRSGKDWKEVSK